MENPNPKCEWCLHEWHEGECWCYCTVATDFPEPEYCDKCGSDLAEVEAFVIFDNLPKGFIASDGTLFVKGEYAALCWNCHVEIGEEQREHLGG